MRLNAFVPRSAVGRKANQCVPSASLSGASCALPWPLARCPSSRAPRRSRRRAARSRASPPRADARRTISAAAGGARRSAAAWARRTSRAPSASIPLLAAATSQAPLPPTSPLARAHGGEHACSQLHLARGHAEARLQPGSTLPAAMTRHACSRVSTLPAVMPRHAPAAMPSLPAAMPRGMPRSHAPSLARDHAAEARTCSHGPLLPARPCRARMQPSPLLLAAHAEACLQPSPLLPAAMTRHACSQASSCRPPCRGLPAAKLPLAGGHTEACLQPSCLLPAAIPRLASAAKAPPRRRPHTEASAAKPPLARGQVPRFSRAPTSHSFRPTHPCTAAGGVFRRPIA